MVEVSVTYRHAPSFVTLVTPSEARVSVTHVTCVYRHVTCDARGEASPEQAAEGPT